MCKIFLMSTHFFASENVLTLGAASARISGPLASTLTLPLRFLKCYLLVFFQHVKTLFQKSNPKVQFEIQTAWRSRRARLQRSQRRVKSTSAVTIFENFDLMNFCRFGQRCKKLAVLWCALNKIERALRCHDALKVYFELWKLERDIFRVRLDQK